MQERIASARNQTAGGAVELAIDAEQEVVTVRSAAPMCQPPLTSAKPSARAIFSICLDCRKVRAPEAGKGNPAGVDHPRPLHRGRSGTHPRPACAFFLSGLYRKE